MAHLLKEHNVSSDEHFSLCVLLGTDFIVRGEIASEGMRHGKISLLTNDDENAGRYNPVMSITITFGM